MIYLDTSWLAKLFVEESGTAAIRRLVAAHTTVVVSDLSRVEFRSAIERRRRERTLTDRDAVAIVAQFGREWATWAPVVVTDEILGSAVELVATHPLRALDAIHLASALLTAAQSPEVLQFGSSDAHLVAAADAEGLPIARTA